MPRLFDAGEYREGLILRIRELLEMYGSGDPNTNDANWRVRPISDGLTVENTEEPGYPKFFVHVEVNN